MKDNKIPENVHRFIISSIDTIGTLEVLKIFLQDRNKSWSVEDLITKLQSSDQSVDRNIKQLLQIEAISSDGSVPPKYRYAPITDSLNDLLTNLNESYKAFPMRVIEIIYSKSNELLRDFSDAFKLRKDPDNA